MKTILIDQLYYIFKPRMCIIGYNFVSKIVAVGQKIKPNVIVSLKSMKSFSSKLKVCTVPYHMNFQCHFLVDFPFQLESHFVAPAPLLQGVYTFPSSFYFSFLYKKRTG